ncbi:hypothetical protein SS50377_25246 [Spironucleus salmonicida]|uniref:Uncharacterized protein n=1 Tax=Spironucleus salmonicida TaxID=348837 RepID=A0A9P8LRV7_9EUKA|nr:hypothetical protein SS50377_25246 [Spironucleus salmonicida]
MIALSKQTYSSPQFLKIQQFIGNICTQYSKGCITFISQFIPKYNTQIVVFDKGCIINQSFIQDPHSFGLSQTFQSQHSKIIFCPKNILSIGNFGRVFPSVERGVEGFELFSVKKFNVPNKNATQLAEFTRLRRVKIWYQEDNNDLLNK